MADIITDPPRLISATRISASSVVLTWENRAKTGATYSQIHLDARVLPSGVMSQVNQWGYPAISNQTYTHVHLTDGTVGYEFALRANGPAGMSERSNTITVAAWQQIPEPQENVTAEYRTSGQFVEWDVVESSDAPVDTQYVFRSDNGGTYRQINRLLTSALSGPPEAYLDAAAPPDTRVQYRLWAANGAGGAYFHSLPSNVLYTTPAAPKNVVLRWINATTLRATWVSDSAIAEDWDVEYQADGGAWLPIDTATAKLLDWPGTQGVTARTRVRAVTPDGERKSGWVYSAVVSAHRKPAQPLVSTSGAQDATEEVRLEWAHQSLDGTGQTWRQIRRRLTGSSTWVEDAAVQTEEDSTTLAPGAYSNGGTLEWQVRTRGASSTWSDYSVSGFVPLRPKPQPTITYPEMGEPWPSRSLTLRWEVTGTQLGWSARVLESPSGELVASRQSTASTASRRQVDFTDILDDAKSYTAEVTVTTTDGVSDPTIVTFPVVLQRPTPPVFEVIPDHDGATLQVTAISYPAMTNPIDPDWSLTVAPSGFGLDPFSISPFGL